jgi:hypothetical protein
VTRITRFVNVPDAAHEEEEEEEMEWAAVISNLD